MATMTIFVRLSQKSETLTIQEFRVDLIRDMKTSLYS